MAAKVFHPTERQYKFIEEYLIDLNATQAAIRAGYAPARANSMGFENLRKPYIKKIISDRMNDRAKRTEITQDMVLQKWWDLANVDVNELVEYRRENCRHCWGIENQYQWTVLQHLQETKKAEKDGKEPPDSSGGFGFDSTRAPNATCPECHGNGYGTVHVKDTRNLDGAARRLYAGVHKGKDGLKVLLEDRGKALENVARHLGMFVDTVKHTGSGPGGSIIIQSTPLDEKL